MKADILSIEGKKVKQVELPECFNEELRRDLIKKAFDASVKRQPYGSFYLAGQQASASGVIKHRRRDYKTGYGYGISRVPRKIMTRRGTHFYWIGAYAPGTRKGRQAHPPKVDKIWGGKINKKEKFKAISSAIAATANLKALTERYNTLKYSHEQEMKSISLPIIIESKISEIGKTKMLKGILEKILGPFAKVAFREKEIRAGHGKKRGRKYKISKGLLVVSAKPLKNLIGLKGLGVDSITPKEMNITSLAPGGVAGRITIYTEDAIEEIKKIRK